MPHPLHQLPPPPPSPPQHGSKTPLLQVTEDLQDEEDTLRLLSRSPHPYHHQSFELPHPADQLEASEGAPPASTPLRPPPKATVDNTLLSPEAQHLNVFPSFAKDSGPSSDSGTEADDEHFLRRLPAPRSRLHKGLRGRNEVLSGTSTPLLSPAILEEEGRHITSPLKRDVVDPDRRAIADTARRRKEIIRRSTECLVLASVAFVWHSNRDVRSIFSTWSREIASGFLVIVSLALLYPIRVLFWTYAQPELGDKRKFPLRIPPTFDPAPILYPAAITLFVSGIIAVDVKSAVLPNLILGLCTLPKPLMPLTQTGFLYDPVHWILSCVPLFVFLHGGANAKYGSPDAIDLDPEMAVLLYPLHQTLTYTLHFLTTTSLLPAELQLLSVAMINLLFLAHSPQMTILRSFLWTGALCVLILCGQVISWGITLARVPKWRFRREHVGPSKRSWLGFHIPVLSQVKRELMGSDSEDEHESELSTDEERELSLKERLQKFHEGAGPSPASMPDVHLFPVLTEPLDKPAFSKHQKHALPRLASLGAKSTSHTPSGRRKRSASMRVRAFFHLTYKQAQAQKWVYAVYVQLCIIAIVLGVVRPQIQHDSLSGSEPIGWFLGYMFGDQQWFRWKTVNANLERWILIPSRPDVESTTENYHLGWIQNLRYGTFGEANTRLLICAYWLAIIAVGLLVVFRLSPFYEVDTRRKVFHFMMVAMFLPATYVDPTFAALALTAALVGFLVLDLIRASQLPPLSKPIARFLTPYVDGRDLRGPVVISHIFLLIGCAIPLWLSLASLPRTGEGVLEGWEVPTREVSMVSGVICVGLGDAAASLIGRRWGHRKWVWGGGKSLEGSVAFTVAVFIGLLFSTAWLRVGGWDVAEGSNLSWMEAVGNSGVCASVASLTEAVLTGGNDNVVVPVVLWTCVKGLGV